MCGRFALEDTIPFFYNTFYEKKFLPSIVILKTSGNPRDMAPTPSFVCGSMVGGCVVSGRGNTKHKTRPAQEESFKKKEKWKTEFRVS